MTTTGHPVHVEIRTPLPIAAALVKPLTDLAQHTADQIGAGTLRMGKHVAQEGSELVARFSGALPDPDDPDDEDQAALLSELAPLATVIDRTVRATPVRLGDPTELVQALTLAVAAYMGRHVVPATREGQAP